MSCRHAESPECPYQENSKEPLTTRQPTECGVLLIVLPVPGFGSSWLCACCLQLLLSFIRQAQGDSGKPFCFSIAIDSAKCFLVISMDSLVSQKLS